MTVGIRLVGHGRNVEYKEVTNAVSATFFFLT